ncbi:MAG: selenocysteine-specific translation elongation factor [Chloroflexia bacterium]|nr:selenocysteine-specific translation elongation factor [Chloroflexia bacterium]
MFVIGTAGHVDHGKSTLVKALSGINPDRLREEQEREMTIDLGFAWLTMPSGREVSIVDVPGHERFIKNMLAGVGGLDAALLVIAADEGVMPQTREHLDILNLLEVSRGVVAITKADLVQDPEWLDLVLEEVYEYLEGTSLEQAPVVPVSARTGQGLPELLAAMDQVLESATSREDLGRPRLPIDRAFTMTGFGTVVTGTLLGGSLRLGQEIEILPQGLHGRIRGLQMHKKKVDLALPGWRTAVNLSGLAVEELERGDVLALPDWLRASRRLVVRLRLLASAPLSLQQDDILDLFVGSAERRVRLTLLEGEELAPGETGWVLLRLRQPTVAVRGDRFILRRPSPSLTIGGGMIVDAHPGRLRRFRPEVIADLEALARGRPEDLLRQAFRGRPRQVRQLVTQSGLAEEQAQATLERLWQQGELLAFQDSQEATLKPTTLLLPREIAESLHERILGLLDRYHQQYPLRPGMPKEELKSQLRLDGRTLNEILTWAEGQASLVVQEALVSRAEHELRFSLEQQAQVDAFLRLLERQPYAPPPRQDWAIEPALLDALEAQERIVRLSPDVAFLPQIYQEMRHKVLVEIDRHGPITVAAVRDLFQTSRKFALALLEDMDRQKVTRRVGDERVRYRTPKGGS